MTGVNSAVCAAAVGPWLGLWESEVYDLLDEYHFDPNPAYESCRIADLVVRDLVPWLSKWPQELRELLRRTVEYLIAYEPDVLFELSSRSTGFSTADPVDAIWMPIWMALFDTEMSPGPQDGYAAEFGHRSAAGEVAFDLPALTWSFSGVLEERGRQQALAQRYTCLVAPTIEVAMDVLTMPIRGRRDAAGVRLLEMSLLGLRSVSHAAELHAQDPRIRWSPDPEGDLGRGAGSRSILHESLYAGERALVEYGQPSRDGYEPGVGTLEGLLAELIGAAEVLGARSHTPDELVEQCTALAASQSSPNGHWEALASLGAAVVEAMAQGNVLVHPG